MQVRFSIKNMSLNELAKALQTGKVLSHIPSCLSLSPGVCDTCLEGWSEGLVL